jgi:glycerol transport system permease protein
MNKVTNNKAWFLVLPVFLLVAFSAIVPIMTVVNYSVQDIFDQNTSYFVGAEWYREMLRSPRLLDSLIRQFTYSFSVLLIEIPLGIAVALMMPAKGRMASVSLILVAIPLLIPWNVVGTIWQTFSRADIGLFGWAVNAIGIDYNYASNASDAWFTVLLMALDIINCLTLLFRFASHSGSLLSSSAHRPCIYLVNLSLHSITPLEKCISNRRVITLYG